MRAFMLVAPSTGKIFKPKKRENPADNQKNRRDNFKPNK